MLKCNKKSSCQQLCVLFSCRKDLREHLKRQMAEKCAELKMHLTNKVKEADYMREVDHSDLSREKERRVQHRKAMTVFRDENKRVQTHTCSPLMLFRWMPETVNAVRSQVTAWGRVWDCSYYLPVCAANGGALEGPGTNAFPGGPQGERAALPQPH